MRKKIIYSTLFLLLFSINLYGDSLDDKQNQINKINNEIKKKGEEIKENTKKIKTIEKKTETLKEQITRVEKEIKAIGNEKKVLQNKIKVVNRKIDYGKRNLKFSSSELTITEKEYLAMLQIWQKKELTSSEDIHSFKEILKANERRQNEIKDVQQNIESVKTEIEKEQRSLKLLESQLAQKERLQESKKRQHTQLIAKYNQEKKETSAKTVRAKSSISNLKKQKVAIEKEIDRIIRARTKQLGNVDYKTIAKNLGSFKKPINGQIVVGFNQLKVGGVRSSGQEIKGELGEKVVAANKGIVIYSGKFMNMGNVVMIDHGYNLITIYGNLIGTYVKLNQKVKKGTTIGVLGLDYDGKSYLYYETRFNLKSSNPNIF